MDPSVRVELLAIGAELLEGKRIDTNTAFIGRQLARIDLEVARKTSVGDSGADLPAAIREAWSRSDLVITSGGLGPTVDDLTREALVEATGLPLREEPEILEAIQRRFAARNVPMPESNRCQALVPVCGGWFSNAHGTAPGLYFEQGPKTLIALPGPPNELCPMMEEQVVPYLAKRYPPSAHWVRATLHFAGVPESIIDQALRSILTPYPEIVVSLLPSLGIIELTLSRRVAPGVENDEQIRQAVRDVRARFGPAIFGEGSDTLAGVIGRRLRESGRTLAIAESCTGGLIAGEITRVPGSSAYFLAGLITYSNAAKVSLLGVRPETLQAHGAVSQPTVEEMAAGVRRHVGADVGLAITGIAGPGGGTPEKPVGTVHIAVCDHERTLHRQPRFALADRDEIRRRAVVAALALTNEFLQAGDSADGSAA